MEITRKECKELAGLLRKLEVHYEISEPSYITLSHLFPKLIQLRHDDLVAINRWKAKLRTANASPKALKTSPEVKKKKHR